MPLKWIKNSSDCPAIKFLGVLFDPELNFKMHVYKYPQPYQNLCLFSGVS